MNGWVLWIGLLVNIYIQVFHFARFTVINPWEQMLSVRSELHDWEQVYFPDRPERPPMFGTSFLSPSPSSPSIFHIHPGYKQVYFPDRPEKPHLELTSFLSGR